MHLGVHKRGPFWESGNEVIGGFRFSCKDKQNQSFSGFIEIDAKKSVVYRQSFK